MNGNRYRNGLNNSSKLVDFPELEEDALERNIDSSNDDLGDDIEKPNNIEDEFDDITDDNYDDDFDGEPEDEVVGNGDGANNGLSSNYSVQNNVNNKKSSAQKSFEHDVEHYDDTISERFQLENDLMDSKIKYIKAQDKTKEKEIEYNKKATEENKKELEKAKLDEEYAKQKLKYSKRSVRLNNYRMMKDAAYALKNPEDAKEFVKDKAKRELKDAAKDAIKKQVRERGKKGAQKATKTAVKNSAKAAKATAKKAAKTAAKAGAKAGASAGAGAAAGAGASAGAATILPWILLGIAILLLVFFLALIIIGVVASYTNQGYDTESGSVMDSEVDYNVNGINSETQVQLLRYDEESGSYISSGTYSLEKYAVGVAVNMVGADADDEVLKAAIVAARSYILSYSGTDSSLGYSNTTNTVNMVEDDADGTLKVEALAVKSYALSNNSDDSILGYSSETNTINIVNSNSNLIYWDYTEDLYKSPTADANGFYEYSPTYVPGEDETPYKTKLTDEQVYDVESTAVGVLGTYVVDSAGEVVNIKLTEANINTMKETAASNSGTANGQYLALLMSVNSDVSTTTSPTVKVNYSADNGSYSNWKQKTSLGASWGTTKIGTSATINDVGCLATSIAMQIAHSGVETPTISDFNPGTFVTEGRKYGCFSSGGAVNSYTCFEKFIPAFKYSGSKYLSGSKLDRLTKVKEYAEKGYYIVIEVRRHNGGQHWVALDVKSSYENGWSDIYIWDPATTKTKLSDQSKYQANRIVYYSV